MYMNELKKMRLVKSAWQRLFDHSELNKSFRISVLDQFSFHAK